VVVEAAEAHFKPSLQDLLGPLAAVAALNLHLPHLEAPQFTALKGLLEVPTIMPALLLVAAAVQVVLVGQVLQLLEEAAGRGYWAISQHL
jgi:hypothetical protein